MVGIFKLHKSTILVPEGNYNNPWIYPMYIKSLLKYLEETKWQCLRFYRHLQTYTHWLPNKWKLKISHPTFTHILKHIPFLICEIYYGIREEGRLAFHLYVFSCQAIADICYLFGPFQHVATIDFYIPLSGLGFQAALAWELAVPMKIMHLEIWNILSTNLLRL